jgi:hypothetical protein
VYFSLYSHACLSFFHSTVDLDLSSNSLMETIPSEIALLSNLCESSGCCLLACCNDCVVVCFSIVL